MAEFQLDVTIDFAIRVFQGKAPEQMAANSDTNYDPKTCLFTVPFLGREYLVRYPDGLVTFKGVEGEVPLIFQVFVLRYLAEIDGTPLKNNWISFKELPDGEIYNPVFKKSAIDPMVAYFGANPNKLVPAGLILGGEELKLGNRSVLIRAFPRVPLALVIWEGDDEFPPSGTILFDETAPRLLTTKDYSMTCTFLVPQLIKIAQSLEEKGND